MGLCRVVSVLCLIAAVSWSAAAAAGTEPPQWRWSGVGRVVTVGDVHGAYLPLVGLLSDVGLVSQDLRWIGGDSHLVMLGDLVDRGPRSRDVLDLVMRLQREAEEAGGRVHVLLGNHEIMNLVGDLRYVTEDDYAAFAVDEDPKYRKAVVRQRLGQVASSTKSMRRVREKLMERCPEGYFAHRRAFAPDGVYGSWLLDQRILVVINDVAYVHGGLPPELRGYSPDEINTVAMSELQTFLEAQQRLLDMGVLGHEMTYPKQLAYAREAVREAGSRPSAAADAANTMLQASNGMVFRTEGPLWYRGTALHPAGNEAETVTAVLDHLGAQTVVVGHTPIHTGRISSRFDGAVVRADTGMLTSHYGGRASAVIQAEGQLYGYYPGEQLTALASERRWELTEGTLAEEEAVLAFLESAPVVSVEDVGAGETNPRRVWLADNGRRGRAIFKDVDEEVDCTIRDIVYPCRHSYRHEAAAYRIDRLLGLGMVPPTVVREIEGTVGSLQLWVEGAINEENRRAEDIQPERPKEFEYQRERAAAFDWLTYNTHRNGTNLLITIRDWRIHLIDHEQAFVPVPTGPPHLDDQRLKIERHLADMIGEMDPEMVRAELEGLLDEAELSALIARIGQLPEDR
jgi:hypothetical protein